jgi:hypothetical protein
MVWQASHTKRSCVSPAGVRRLTSAPHWLQNFMTESYDDNTNAA